MAKSKKDCIISKPFVTADNKTNAIERISLLLIFISLTPLRKIPILQ